MFIVVARLTSGKTANGNRAGHVTFCETRDIAQTQAHVWERMHHYDYVGVFEGSSVEIETLT